MVVCGWHVHVRSFMMCANQCTQHFASTYFTVISPSGLMRWAFLSLILSLTLKYTPTAINAAKITTITITPMIAPTIQPAPHSIDDRGGTGTTAAAWRRHSRKMHAWSILFSVHYYKYINPSSLECMCEMFSVNTIPGSCSKTCMIDHSVCSNTSCDRMCV